MGPLGYSKITIILFHKKLKNMKKKIIGGIAVLAIAAAAAWNVNLSSNGNDLSDVSLANVEALAECENTVDTSGGLIVVTVCDRKTSVMDLFLGIKCNTPDNTSCQFTNVG
jgi:hypothetical protein